MLETLFLALVALAPVEASPPPPWAGSMLKLASAPSYQPASRTVDNWRLEGALNLDLSPLQAIGLAAGNDLAQTPRCVKLNNYWCIKRAGWNGEIAADSEGHVAFASALEGAAVAALLLKRYYVEYGRRTARAIVSRWAPAQCSPILAATRITPAAPSIPEKPTANAEPRAAPAPRVKISRMLPQRVTPMGLAPRGIENTLRARWLAAHGRGGIGVRTSHVARKSVRSRIAAADTVSDLMRAPAIAVGMGEAARGAPRVAERARRAPVQERDPPAALPERKTSASKISSEQPAPPSGPVFNCSAEYARIANYAARVAEGVASGPDEDLKLFEADGSPTEKLPIVMANMAAVEIGPLRASNSLISLAVSQLRTSSAQEAPVQKAQ